MKPLQFQADSPKISGPRRCVNTDPALDINQTLGGPVMPDCTGNIRADDSASNPEHAPPNGGETLPRAGQAIARSIAAEVARLVRERRGAAHG